jgi:hypothetical protein
MRPLISKVCNNEIRWKQSANASERMMDQGTRFAFLSAEGGRELGRDPPLDQCLQGIEARGSCFMAPITEAENGEAIDDVSAASLSWKLNCLIWVTKVKEERADVLINIFMQSLPHKRTKEAAMS